MDNDAALKQLAETVEQFDTKKLISSLNDFIIASYGIAAAKRYGKPVGLRDETVEREISAALSRTALILSHMSNLSFSPNGENAESREGNTLFWLKAVKKHQMAVLMDISDDIEIIGSVIRQSERVKRLVLGHSPVLEKAAYLTDILHDRIINRPTAFFRLDADDEEVERLNETIRNMRDYEDTFGPVFERDMENNDPEKSLGTLRKLISESCGEIEKRKKRIVTGMEELNQGWKLFNKLATKGYSRRLRRKLGATAERHHRRITVFRELIRKNRDADMRVH